jgi:rubredoxin
LTLDGLLFAQNRLSAGHPAQLLLAAKQASVEAGIGEEERVAEIFRKHPFPFEHHIFHDLSPSLDDKFQIDTFCLIPWHGVILEVKNIAGVLEFKNNPPQLIRTREDGHKDGFDSPVVQLERNCELLKDWLSSRNIQLPIYGTVVLAYPKQIVAVPPAKTKLLFPSLIPSYFKSLPQHGKKLDKETFDWVSAELLRSHQPFIPKPICETYKIPFGDFQGGARCGACGRIGMIKIPRTWYCPYCKVTNSHAHFGTLREWFLIFKRSMSNRECREFLQIDDIHTATRILQSMNLRSEGTYRYRTYVMDFNQLK